MHAMILMFLLCVSFHAVLSLDVSFIPNDENAPLPLSTTYRTALRKLCVIMEAGKKLPESIDAAKLRGLKAACRKLKKVRLLWLLTTYSRPHKERLGKRVLGTKRGKRMRGEMEESGGSFPLFSRLQKLSSSFSTRPLLTLRSSSLLAF
jgi:hypothetical protein